MYPRESACRKKDHTIPRKLILDYTKCRRLIMDHPKCRSLIIDHSKCRKLIIDHTICRRLIIDHPKCRRRVLDHTNFRRTNHKSHSASPQKLGNEYRGWEIIFYLLFSDNTNKFTLYPCISIVSCYHIFLPEYVKQEHI